MWAALRMLLIVSMTLVLGAAPLWPSGADPIPTAAPSAGLATVGPIFRGATEVRHSCTGSVVDSPTHDLVLTAAHCVYGTAQGWRFVPGYRAGKAPNGVWIVVHAYVDPQWRADQDERHDFAVLQLARQQHDGRLVGVQDVVGANEISLAPAPGDVVRVVAYNHGVDDRALDCSAHAYLTHGFPTFDCHGYVGGSSGSPWLTESADGYVVRGVIGGLHQGGCTERTSYSSAFTASVVDLIVRAAQRRDPDDVARAGPDGC